MADRRPSVEKSLIRESRLNEVRRAVASLHGGSSRGAAVLEFYWVTKRWSTRKSREFLNCSESAVKSLRFRARTRRCGRGWPTWHEGVIANEMPNRDSKENARSCWASYSARRLSPENAAAFEAHLEACPACREFRDSQGALWEALDRWEARPVSLDFDRRLYRRIEEQERQGWWTRIFGSARPMFLRPALPLAATACLVLVAGFIIDNPVRTLPVAESPKVQEVEQLERTLEDMEMLRQFNLVSPVTEEKEVSRSM